MAESSNPKEDASGKIQGPVLQYMPCYPPEDEIDLVQLLSVPIRRKWVIFLCVFVLTGLSAIYCVVATPKFRILAQIRPGITGYNQQGQPVYGFKAKDIQEWFSKKAYMEVISANMPEVLDHAPKVTATNPRGSDVVSMDFYWPDPEQGKKIASLLLDHLSESGTKSVAKSLAVSRGQIQEMIAQAKTKKEGLDLRKAEINDEISAEKNQIKVLRAEITRLDQDKKQTEELANKISKQIKAVNKNTADLMGLRNKIALSSQEQLALLMYSNIIQQNISYEINLQQSLSQLKKDLNQFEVEKAEKAKQIKDVEFSIKKLITERDERLALQRAQLDQEISTLKTRLSALSPVEMVQPPFSSSRPEKPKKGMIIAISFALSWLVGIFAAFVYDFWAKNKERLSGRDS